jgi:hypothetical protein
MYVYFSPQGGFNDMLSNIKNTIDYCVKTKRTLLIDTTKCCYGINFSDYFYLKNIPISIIADVNEIRKIITDESLTIYPDSITDRNMDKWEFIWVDTCTYILNGVYMGLPQEKRSEAIIVHSTCGGGRGINLFKNLIFNQNIIEHIKHVFAKLPAKYIAIQVRNTDIKCNYVSLYNINKKIIHSFDTVYVATDDPESLKFFREQGLNVLNFTEFPINPTFNLHYSTVSSDTKIKNMLCDLYIVTMAHTLVSNSEGGFINLVRDIRKDVSIFRNKIV